MYSRDYGYIPPKPKTESPLSEFGEEKQKKLKEIKHEYKSKKEEIPIKSFSEKDNRESFDKMYAHQSNYVPEMPLSQMQNYENQQFEQANTNQPSCTCANEQEKSKVKKKGGLFTGLENIFGNFAIDDLILIGLMFLFLRDEDKENDMIIPILLLILLLF